MLSWPAGTATESSSFWPLGCWALSLSKPARSSCSAGAQGAGAFALIWRRRPTGAREVVASGEWGRVVASACCCVLPLVFVRAAGRLRRQVAGESGAKGARRLQRAGSRYRSGGARLASIVAVVGQRRRRPRKLAGGSLKWIDFARSRRQKSQIIEASRAIGRPSAMIDDGARARAGALARPKIVWPNRTSRQQAGAPLTQATRVRVPGVAVSIAGRLVAGETKTPAGARVGRLLALNCRVKWAGA